jgi:hypothetical protein
VREIVTGMLNAANFLDVFFDVAIIGEQIHQDTGSGYQIVGHF